MRWLRLLLTRLFGAAQARPTVRQKRIALVVAGLADVTQMALAPAFAEGALSPLDAALDVMVAAILFLTLGRRKGIALALGLELVPGMALFPTWTAMVAMLPAAAHEAPAEPVPALAKS
jgi:hypothetical protein